MSGGKWAAGIVGAILLGLGVNSAVRHVNGWLSPPPPPLANQIDRIVHAAAIGGWTLEYQTVGRLRAGGDLSCIRVFEPRNPYANFGRSSELRIYDLRGRRLHLAYRLRPTLHDQARSGLSLGISVLEVGRLSQSPADQIVATLDVHAADALPAVPVVIGWDARRDDYTVRAILTKSTRPDLHGDVNWRRIYLRPLRIVNAADRTQRLVSDWTEAVQLERGRSVGEHSEPTPVLMGLFYADAKARAFPRKFEVNIWPLSEDLSECALATKNYPPPPMFVSPKGSFSWTQLLSDEWQRIRTRVLCD